MTTTNDQSMRREVKKMNEQARYRLRIANEIRQRQIDEAASWRIARADRGRQSQPIRRFIGRSIIRIGERLAAEPSILPARSIQ
jgi:hypothetical protein